MAKGLEELTKMDYPGRVIMLGQTESGKHAVVFAITGRSDSSQARTIEFDKRNNVFYTKPTDPKKIAEGSPSLLLYPAMVVSPEQRSIIVSNGYQTNLIYNASLEKVEYNMANEVLEKALTRSHYVYDEKYGWIDVTSFEPDAPNFTPRISGCAKVHGYALAISRKKEDSCEAVFLERDWVPGKGKLLATYTGENKDPLPSFEGNPLDVEIKGETPFEIGNDIYYKALKIDNRVSLVALVQSPKTGNFDFHIVNRRKER